MLQSVPDILARIVERKRDELEMIRGRRTEYERLATETRAQKRDFVAALTGRRRAIIAEMKKASPSKGLLAPDFNPTSIAGAYEAGGAACISVLTDRDFFAGSLGDLTRAREAVSLPVLRKDFTTTEDHVLEAAAHGADAILLIAAILEERQLRDYRDLAGDLGMAALVEVHDEAELDRTLASGAELIGVNNRDLRTFEVSLETSVRLAERIPAGLVRVAESGIHGSSDIAKLEEAGYHAFLVGEHLMKSGDPQASLEALLQ